jgi:hypothetical protein
MAGEASAYAVLGVEPDADSAEIEQAYRRLIKQHHPDREGGDSGRAADINRAYRELRQTRDLKDPLEFNLALPAERHSAGFWLTIALIVVLGAGAWLLSQGNLPPLEQAEGPPVRAAVPASHARAVERDDVMDQPLNLGPIEAAAGEALRMSRTGDEMALADATRDCQRELRSSPSLLRFDRCAAFDDAVVQLQDRDPLRDQGPFSELAVTGRLWSAASGLSEDSVAIDSRLNRIRLQVELALAGVPAPARRP